MNPRQLLEFPYGGFECPRLRRVQFERLRNGRKLLRQAQFERLRNGHKRESERALTGLLDQRWVQSRRAKFWKRRREAAEFLIPLHGPHLGTEKQSRLCPSSIPFVPVSFLLIFVVPFPFR